MSVDGLGVCGTCDGAVNGAISGICNTTIGEISRALGVSWLDACAHDFFSKCLR